MKRRMISIVLICCMIIVSFLPVFTGEYRGNNMFAVMDKEDPPPPESGTGSLYKCIGLKPYVLMILTIGFLLLSVKKNIFAMVALCVSVVNVLGLWVYGSDLMAGIVYDARYWVRLYTPYGKILFGLSIAVVVCIIIESIYAKLSKSSESN